jgi:chromosome segregation ATPase
LEEATSRLEDVESQSTKLRAEVEVSWGVFVDLEKQNAELRLAISTLKNMLGSAQEKEVQLKAENDALEQRLQRFRTQLIDDPGCSLPKDESKAELEKALHEKDELMKENANVREQLELANQRINALVDKGQAQEQEAASLIDHSDRSAELGQLKTENSSLQSRLQILATESDQQKAAAVLLQEEIEQLKSENQKLKNSLSSLQAGDQLTRENRSLREQLELANQQISEYSELVEESQRWRQEAASVLNQTSSSAEVEQLKTENSSLRNQIQTLTTDCAANTKAAHRDAEVLRVELDAAGQRSSELEAENHELRSDNDRLQQRVTSLTAASEQLRAELQALSSQDEADRVRDLESQIRGLSSENGRLKQEVSSLNSQTQSDSLKLQSQNQLIAQVTNEKEAVTQSLYRLEAEVQALPSQREPGSQNQPDRVRSLESQIGELSAENSRLKQELSSLNSQRQVLESEIEQLTTERASTSQTIAKLQELRSQDSLQSQIEENARLKQELNSLASEHQTVIEQLAKEKESERRQSDVGGNRQQSEITKLKESLAQAEREISELVGKDRQLEQRNEELFQQSVAPQLDDVFQEKQTLKDQILQLSNDLKQEKQGHKRDVNELNSRIRRLESENRLFEEKIQSAESEVRSNETKIEALRAESRSQLVQIHDLKRSITSERAQSESLRLQLKQTSSISAFLQQKDEKINDLERENEALREQLKPPSPDQDISHLLRQNANLRTRLKQKTEEVERSQINMKEFQKQNQELRRKLNVSMSNRNRQKLELSKLKDQLAPVSLAGLQSQIAVLKDELDDVRSVAESVFHSESEHLEVARERVTGAIAVWQLEREESDARPRTRGAKKAARCRATEDDKSAELQAQIQRYDQLDVRHRRALRLLGEYHCRIQALTHAAGQRPDKFHTTK